LLTVSLTLLWLSLWVCDINNVFQSKITDKTSGWNYWYTFAMLLAAEVTAVAIIIQYWTESVPVAVWIAIILLVILALNIIAVSFFGEAEFIFCSIKILAILGLIVLGIVLFFGGGPNHDRLGFRYWKEGNPVSIPARCSGKNMLIRP
jgi:amino acid permease